MSNGSELCEALRRTIACVDQGDRRVLGPFHLTPPRYHALKHICENPGVSLTTLSTMMLIDKSSATRLVRSMEREGLVRRRRSDTDHRTHRLYLSELGNRRFQSALAAYDRSTQDRFSSLEIDLEALVSDLEVVAHSLERAATQDRFRR